MFPTGLHFQGGCNLALITSRHKKKTLLPANGSEKRTTGYCNHNNVLGSSQTENEVPDKHMLFLIKNDLVLSGPHRLQRLLCESRRGGETSTLGMPRCLPSITIISAFSPLCNLSLAAKQSWCLPFSAFPTQTVHLLASPHKARPNSVLNVLSGYLGLGSFGQN